MKTSSVQSSKLVGLLADTWWYGLTKRLSEANFRQLAELRAAQGFSAVQLVAGIPPEVGPANPNAASSVGPAWDLAGQFNRDYLLLAARRVSLLNDLGLRVIIYGAWGHQIRWLGREKMLSWWREIVHHLDHLDVIYCLTGESNLWIGQEELLLPDRSTSDLRYSARLRWLPTKLGVLTTRIARRLRRLRPNRNEANKHLRQEEWSYILDGLAAITSRPLIVHTNAGETARQAVKNSQLLAANTTQTGHSEQSRDALWQLPLRELAADPQQLFVNLEPWYEGINGHFFTVDQLYAYWVTMLAGAASYCYGAHGIWNIGDGQFLAHWGKQTFDQALKLETPRLLGRSHEQFMHYPELSSTSYETDSGRLLRISRHGSGRTITFYPDIALARASPSGRFWLPLHADYSTELPAAGPVVIFDSH